MEDRSYRQSFAGDVCKVLNYDKHVVGPGSYGGILWDIEKRLLDVPLGQVRSGPLGRVRYLDFACGSGRVAAYVEQHVETACGVDVSSEMLELAAGVVARTRLELRDLTVSEPRPDESYNLITAFRFFLNAEPELRDQAMRALARRLDPGPSGRIVVTVQGHTPSRQTLRRWSLRLRRRQAGAVLPERVLRQLANRHGLEVEAFFGYDVFGGVMLRKMPAKYVALFEGALAGTRLANRIGAHRMYVLREL